MEYLPTILLVILGLFLVKKITGAVAKFIFLAVVFFAALLSVGLI